jgi:hypothetical protein
VKTRLQPEMLKQSPRTSSSRRVKEIFLTYHQAMEKEITKSIKKFSSEQDCIENFLRLALTISELKFSEGSLLNISRLIHQSHPHSKKALLLHEEGNSFLNFLEDYLQSKEDQQSILINTLVDIENIFAQQDLASSKIDLLNSVATIGTVQSLLVPLIRERLSLQEEEDVANKLKNHHQIIEILKWFFETFMNIFPLDLDLLTLLQKKFSELSPTEIDLIILQTDKIDKCMQIPLLSVRGNNSERYSPFQTLIQIIESGKIKFGPKDQVQFTNVVRLMKLITQIIFSLSLIRSSLTPSLRGARGTLEALGKLVLAKNMGYTSVLGSCHNLKNVGWNIYTFFLALREGDDEAVLPLSSAIKEEKPQGTTNISSSNPQQEQEEEDVVHSLKKSEISIEIIPTPEEEGDAGEGNEDSATTLSNASSVSLDQLQQTNKKKKKAPIETADKPITSTKLKNQLSRMLSLEGVGFWDYYFQAIDARWTSDLWGFIETIQFTLEGGNTREYKEKEEDPHLTHKNTTKPKPKKLYCCNFHSSTTKDALTNNSETFKSSLLYKQSGGNGSANKKATLLWYETPSTEGKPTTGSGSSGGKRRNIIGIYDYLISKLTLPSLIKKQSKNTSASAL